MLRRTKLETTWIFHLPLWRLLKAESIKACLFCALSCDPYPFDMCIEAGLLDEIASSSDFEKRIMEKAEDLASLSHPHYAKLASTSETALEAISNALPVKVRHFLHLSLISLLWGHSSAGERLLCTQEVGGSIPSGSTKNTSIFIITDT